MMVSERYNMVLSDEVFEEVCKAAKIPPQKHNEAIKIVITLEVGAFVLVEITSNVSEPDFDEFGLPIVKNHSPMPKVKPLNDNLNSVIISEHKHWCEKACEINGLMQKVGKPNDLPLGVSIVDYALGKLYEELKLREE